MPNVNTPSATYNELAAARVVPEDLSVGLHLLRQEAKAKIYLPRNPTEVPVNVPGYGRVDPWWNRVEMSRLKNMFKDAVEDVIGRAYAKPAKANAGTPEEIIEFFDDVDGRGTNFHVFAMSVCAGSTTVGEDFVLVDYPTIAGATGMTAEEWDNLRQGPFWRRYPASSVIGWTHQKFGKQERLVRVRLREVAQIPEGAWGSTKVTQVRVLYAGDPLAPEGSPERWVKWEVWRPSKIDEPEGEWFVYARGDMMPMVDIPLVNFPFLLAPPFEAYPPFLDLGHLTIAHYRKTSDLDNAQHAVGYPILHWAGGAIDPESKLPIGMGPQRFLVSADTGAHIEFVEPNGTSWASLRSELNAMEDNAKELANAPVNTQASGNLTATGEAIRAAKASSRLEAAVLGWQDSFNRLLYYTAQYMGLVEYNANKGWGGVQLNRRFVPITRNIEGVQAALEAHFRGRVSDETLHEVMLAAEIIPEGIDFETEQQRIEESGPTLAEQDREAAAELVKLNSAGKGEGEGADPEENANSGAQDPNKPQI